MTLAPCPLSVTSVNAVFAHMADSIGASVRSLRLAKGLGVRQLAKLAECSHGLISDIENHDKNVTTEQLRRIAAVLGADLVPQIGEGEQPLLVSDVTANYAVGRSGLLARFARIVPKIHEDELDVVLHELEFWERRYGVTT